MKHQQGLGVIIAFMHTQNDPIRRKAVQIIERMERKNEGWKLVQIQSGGCR